MSHSGMEHVVDVDNISMHVSFIVKAMLFSEL